MITLKTVDKHSAQQVFNQIANHLLTQNKRASTKRQCEYLTKSGLKCAVGCMIGTKEYCPEWEGLGWHYIAAQKNIRCHMNLIEHLQDLHDNQPPTQWRKTLEAVAKAYNLSAQWMIKDGTHS